jgi:DNA-binding transcriptional LysR family regulator
MEIYQLRAFITVAELGHLTRAAERLHLSQPALSAQIKALEDELGIALFDRSPSGMSLTSAGKRLLKEAERTLAASQQLRNVARSLQGELQGRIKVGTVSDPGTLRLGEFLSRVVDGYPLLEIDFHQEVSGLALDQVREGELDASFYFGDPPEAPLVGKRLRGMTYRIVAPAHWRERIAAADWAGIAAMPWIMTPGHSTHYRMVQALFQGKNLEPHKVAEADQEAVIANLVVAGVGLSLVREEVALRERDAGRLAVWEKAKLETSLWFVYPAERAQDPVVRAMLDVLSLLWEPAPAKIKAEAAAQPAV